MSFHRFLRVQLLLALFLGALAAFQFFWGAKLFARLPKDLVSETWTAGKCRFHRTPTAEAEEYELTVRRRDCTLTNRAEHAIVQGDLHWVRPGGVNDFEVLALYGVERQTRTNSFGYGTEDRDGQYVFPQHTEKKTYRLWDPFYPGPRVARYDYSEEFGGLPVYVFDVVATGIDESARFAALPDVPEKYRALTDGRTKVWIEPHSGTVVDLEDSRTSYFVESATGQRVGEIFTWSNRYTPETAAAQLRLAQRERRRILALERGIPGTLVLGALICAAAGRRRPKPLPLPLVIAQPEEVAV